MAVAGLKWLPGRVLTDINRRVGFRLMTKFGTRGAINLVKAVPFVGGGVGAGVNIAAINQIARYSKSTFVPLGDGMVWESSSPTKQRLGSQRKGANSMAINATEIPRLANGAE